MAIKLMKAPAAGHTAGIFADMTLDGPEIGTLVAVIDRAKNLPSRRTIGKQDPYCALRLGKEAKKTETDRRGGQTPRWDQELRFTVREAPDYYKLKCSVFNDDKRTDLIGESWIDLSDLIKPGGGSNDLWHQLNYKGKYAGDVRIELTYYDIRPREEKAMEKKKVRGKTQAMDDGNNTAAVARQLGPREVRRRPLPVSPATASPVQTPPASEHSNQAPIPPPKIPLGRQDCSTFQPKSRTMIDEQYVFDPYAEDFPAVQPAVQQYRRPFCEDLSPSAEYPEESVWFSEQDQMSTPVYPSSHAHSEQQFTNDPSEWTRESESWQQNQCWSTDQTSANGHYSSNSYGVPHTPPRQPEGLYNTINTNTSPSKSAHYRDSPLRHSISQQDEPHSMVEEPELYDAPPPPPPMHRDTPPRKRQPEFPPSAYSTYDHASATSTPRSLDNSSRRKSVDDRSPLQHLEDQLEPYRSGARFEVESYVQMDSRKARSQNSIDSSTLPRHSSYDAYQNHRFSTSQPEFSRQERADEFFQEPPYQTTRHQGRSGSYDNRRISRGPIDDQEYQNSTPPHSAHSTNSQPELYRPQPIRPQSNTSNHGQVPQRKAVSPAPPHSDSKRLSSTPFGPDAYDVLNPASSPTTNVGTIYQTPEQSKEAARLMEVDKLRDQGPIIGNDGRVIDPSDHLPSDTWAPEPERKNRPPEHVIHFRTKTETRANGSPNSASANVRTRCHRQPQAQEEYFSSPASAPSSGSRNRLQKPSSARPLPSQPYVRSQPDSGFSTPVKRSPISEQPPSRDSQRQSYHDASPGLYRPQLSEYQVPASSSYNPRDSMPGNGFSASPKHPQLQTGREYNPRCSNFYDDPLAAELSMIDIGPSRGGQMVLSRRAY